VDGTIVPNANVDGVWTRTEAAPKTQRLTVDNFIRWRKYLLCNVASVTVGGAVTVGEAEDRFRAMVDGKSREEIAAVFAPKVDGVKVEG
jgi:hypothetical protein